MRKFSTCLLLVALNASIVSSARAEDPKNIFDETFGVSSLTPPTNLAASALSVGTDSIAKITSSDQLITSLGNSIDASGKFRWTGGLEISPYALGASIDGDEYRNNLLKQLLARSRVSFAMSEGETQDSEGSLAVGFQSVLYDRGDTYLRPTAGNKYNASKACFEKHLETAQRKWDVEQLKKEAEQSEGSSSAEEIASGPIIHPSKYKECIEQIRRSTWNDASLGLGFVTVSRADENEITDISQSNNIGYVSASYGFDWLDTADNFTDTGSEISSKCGDGFHLSCNAHLVFQLKYQSNGVYEIPNIGEKSGESIGWGTKLVAGSAKSSGYAFYRQENVEIENQEFDVHEYGIGFETRVFGDQWLVLSVSRLDNELMPDDETVAKATFSFNFNDAAKFVNPFASN